jgi:hypothetical protein
MRFFKSYSLVVLIVFLSLSAFAQPKSFSNNPEKFIGEMEAYFRDTKADEDTRKALNAFQKIYESPAYSIDQKNLIILTANKMADRKMKADQEYQDYLNALIFIQKSSRAIDNFTIVHSILETSLKKKNREASLFLNFASRFFDGNILYESKSTKWYLPNDNYELKMDSIPVLKVLGNTNIIGEARGDHSVIYNTTGTYYPTKRIWKGKEGIVNWTRGGQDSTVVYAKLKKYQIDCTKSDFSADSVQFYHTKLFKTALVGRLEDRLSTNNKPENATYPKFDSYQKKYEIKDFFTNVDYQGGFSMVGSKLYGIGSDDEKASITIYSNGKVILKTYANAYVLQSDEVVSYPAEISIYLQKDSIYHPGVEFKFNAAKRTMVLLRRDNGIGNASFYDSYHQMSYEVERMEWNIDKPVIEMGMIKGRFQQESYFESKNFYKEEKFRKISGISETNPLTILKRLSNREGSRIINISTYAKEVKLKEQDVLGLLRSLVEYGFIGLNENKGLIYVKEKTFNYISNEAGKLDYDVIRFGSMADSNINAFLNINTKDLEIQGIEQIFLSDSQSVNIRPYAGKVKVKQNRDMEFGGKVHAGTLDFYGKNFSFSYDNFKIDMPKIDSLKIKVLSDANINGYRQLLSLKTVLRDINGKLYIDEPSNKSGLENHPQYPYFQSLGESYVYYDYAYIQNSAYRRSDFWFKIEPFIIDSLDNISSTTGLAFPGLMHSGGIFPDFQETLTYQPDTSLGYVTRTPVDGYPMYKGKARYFGKIQLSDKGFFGSGSINYISSITQSDRFLFLLDSTNARIQTFDLEERPNHPLAISRMSYFHWEPYEDSMFVSSMKNSTNLYNGKNDFTGTICYTPLNLTGNGRSHIEGADLYSRRFVFNNKTFEAEHSIAKIYAVDTTKLAIEAGDVKSKIDFVARRGDFVANNPNELITFPYNLYATSLPVFTWFFDEKRMDFSMPISSTSKYKFVSIHPSQDSLNFEAQKATYDLVQEDIKIDGVPKILVADAEIKPVDKHVEIYGQAIMKRLENAQIFANTKTRYHRLYNSKVDVFGRNKYAANAYYDYRTKSDTLAQKIHFEFTKVDTTFQTFAKGTITDSMEFLLNSKVRYKGDVYLKAANRFLDYDGFIRMNHTSKFINSQYFRYKGFVNPDTVALSLIDPRDENKNRLFSGIHIGITNYEAYGTFLSKKLEPNDVDVINVEGKLIYDEKNKLFKIGDDSKLFGNGMTGSYMTFDDKKEFLYAEGKLNLGVDFGDKFKISTAGNVSDFIENDKVVLDMVASLDFEFQPDATALMLKLIDLNGFDINGDNKDRPVFEKAMYELFPEKDVKNVIGGMMETGLYKLPKSMEKGFVISGVKLAWDQQKRSWRSVDNKLSIMSVYDKQVNKEFRGYMEVVRKRSGNIVNIYFEVSGEWFFYTYRQGQMEAISSDESFNKVLTEKTKANSPYSISAIKRKLDFVRSFQNN